MKSTGEKVLSLRNLTMNYGSKQVLRGIDLEVYQGQIIGYIGPNGAGKSTTVKIMLGLIDGYKGEVEVFGQNIASGDPTYKRRIGYVPENAEAYDNLTASEYLTFTGELYGMDRNHAEEKAVRLMKEFDLGDVIHTRLSSFSKGMKQKVLIISSLLHDPDLLFLDEPLSGLDANSMMIIREVLSQLAAQGKTIFYSSHIMDLVEKISTRIVLIVKGKVVADGSFEELQALSEEGTLAEIFNQLTGFTEHRSIAEKFVSIVREEDGDA
ncbi:ABC transporter ATP-binding protein [Sporosarcina limicola]|uniref:ABC-2 type transport system ATP-binding protein n=1 Tax=Sporosarcina limicola TaxID=34101 RepID=A0A927MNW2_9BACL|nr:ABC transporter ATP-binding protein [Sporosarcina limicola]MBE1556567.1 ABC-2 type transport system ATP-binding protein [Sporosarcina limicola]